MRRLICTFVVRTWQNRFSHDVALLSLFLRFLLLVLWLFVHFKDSYVVICWERAHLLVFRLCCFTLCRPGCLCSLDIWAASWQNKQNDCTPSEDSEHPPSPIRVFAVRMKKASVLSYPSSAQQRLWSDWADAQADLSLRWAYSHFVGFVMKRLICCWGEVWKSIVLVPDHCFSFIYFNIMYR